MFNFFKIKEKKEKVEINKGDVVICHNNRTKEPVVIPYADRFFSYFGFRL